MPHPTAVQVMNDVMNNRPLNPVDLTHRLIHDKEWDAKADDLVLAIQNAMNFVIHDPVMATEPNFEATLRLLKRWYTAAVPHVANDRAEWTRENLMRLFRDISTLILFVQKCTAARGTAANKAHLLRNSDGKFNGYYSRYEEHCCENNRWNGTFVD